MAQAPTQDFIVNSGLTVLGTSTVTSSTGNTSTLQVDGGAAIAKNLIVGLDAEIHGDLIVRGNLPFLSVTTGTFTNLTVTGLSTLNAVTAGITTASQLDVAARLLVGGLSQLNNATLVSGINSTSSTTGALTVAGGVGIEKDLYVGGNAYVNGSQVLTTASIDLSTLQSATERGSSTTIAISVLNTTSSTSTNSGALTVVGGVGIGGNIYSAGRLWLGDSTESYSNLTTATVGSYAARSINLIDSAANIKLVRINNSFGPGVELFAVNTDSSFRSVWDFAINPTVNEDVAVIRWRTTGLSGAGGAERIRFYGNSSTVIVSIPSTQTSVSTSTGALVVNGGVGIGGELYIGGIVNVTNTTSATSTTTGALVISGGVGIGGALYVTELYASTASYINNSLILTTSTIGSFAVSSIEAGTDTAISTSTGAVVIWNTGTLQTVTDRGAETSNAITISNSTLSTSTITGALTVAGGVGIGENLYVGGTIYGTLIGLGSISTATNLAGGTAGQVPYQTAPGATSFYGPGTAGNVLVSNGTSAPTYNNTLTLSSTLSNTTTVAGNALQVQGGVGINGSLFVNGISVFSTMQTTNVVALGTLSVTGTTTLGVLNATSATFSGTLGVTGTSVLNGLQATNIVASGTLGVTGTSVLNGLQATNIVASGTLGVTGTTTLRILNATSATFSGTLGVTGTTTLGILTATSATFSGISTVTNTTAATSTSTGALQVRGGAGIGGALYVTELYASTASYINNSLILTTATIGSFAVTSIIAGTDTAISSSIGAVTIWNTSTLQTVTDRSSTTTNAVDITNSTLSTSTDSGALTVAGGVGIGGDLYVGGTVYGAISGPGIISTATNIANGTAGQVPYQSAPGVTNFYGPGIAGNVLVSNGTGAPTYNNTLTLASTASNTSTVAGNALQVLGGVGIDGSLYVNGPAYFQNNVIFAGTSTYVYSTNTVYTDNLINMHVPVGSTGTNHNWIIDDGQDIGLVFHYYKGQDKNAFLGLANDSGYLEWYSDGEEVGAVFTGTAYGVFKTGGIILTSTTATNSTNSGALIVAGGVGIGGNLHVGNTATLSSTVHLGGVADSESLRVLVPSTAGGAYETVQAGSNFIEHRFGGSQSNISLRTIARGTGSINFSTNNSASTLQFSVSHTASAVNYVQVTGAATGGRPTISAQGSDTNVGLNLITKGGTGIFMYATGGSNVLMTFAHTTSGVNYFQTNNAAAGLGPNLQAVGSDTDIDLRLTPKGTGKVLITSTTSATSTATGALVVYGGVGIGGALYVKETSYIDGAQILTTATIGNFGVSTITAGTDTVVTTSTGAVLIYNTSTLQSVTDRGAATTNAVSITNTTSSISTTTGALQVSGGVGVGGSVYVGNRVGFVNASNVSRVYQVYNAATDSLDTVFG